MRRICIRISFYIIFPIRNAKKPSRIRSWIVDVFDLDLLHDKIFVNIIVGMAIAAYAEINFSILTPFILSELNFSDYEIASAISALATADIIARFVSPFIGDYLHLSPRVMYMISLGLLIATRMSAFFLEREQNI